MNISFFEISNSIIDFFAYWDEIRIDRGIEKWTNSIKFIMTGWPVKYTRFYILNCFNKILFKAKQNLSYLFRCCNPNRFDSWIRPLSFISGSYKKMINHLSIWDFSLPNPIVLFSFVSKNELWIIPWSSWYIPKIH